MEHSEYVKKIKIKKNKGKEANTVINDRHIREDKKENIYTSMNFKIQ